MGLAWLGGHPPMHLDGWGNHVTTTQWHVDFTMVRANLKHNTFERALFACSVFFKILTGRGCEIIFGWWETSKTQMLCPRRLLGYKISFFFSDHIFERSVIKFSIYYCSGNNESSRHWCYVKKQVCRKKNICCSDNDNVTLSACQRVQYCHYSQTNDYKYHYNDISDYNDDFDDDDDQRI